MIIFENRLKWSSTVSILKDRLLKYVSFRYVVLENLKNNNFCFYIIEIRV